MKGYAVAEVPRFADPWLDVLEALVRDGRIRVELPIWAEIAIGMSLYAQAKAGGLDTEFYASMLEHPCKQLGVSIEEMEAVSRRLKGT